MNNNMIAQIMNANSKYDAAVRRGSGVNASKESLKNVLFNARAELVKVIDGGASKIDVSELDKANEKIKELEAQLESLNQALIESDEQNNELRKKLKPRKKGEADAEN